MLLLSSLALPLLVLFSAAGARPSRHETPAFVPPRPSVPRLETPSEDAPVVSRNGTQLPSYSQTYYFNQLIDHNDPGLGTFKQRYWHTWEWYEAGEHYLTPYTAGIRPNKESQVGQSSSTHPEKRTQMVHTYVHAMFRRS